MKDKRPISSIFIPTYNGGKKLNYSLGALIRAVKDRDDVEIIVSDNCSTDDTKEILADLSKECDKIEIHRNEINLGFNGNIKLIIDNYASGKYCWIIGDDDVININTFEGVINLLNKGFSFVCVNVGSVSTNEIDFNKDNEPCRIEFKNACFFKCLDLIASKNNVLGTFMSSHIFLLDRIKEFDKSIFGNNDWQDYKNVFPNSYMMTNTFYKDDNCCCIITPIVYAMKHDKSWGDKIPTIFMKILPEYYNYCNSLDEGKGNLKRNYMIIESSMVDQTISDIKNLRFKGLKYDMFLKNFFYKRVFEKILSKFVE